MPKTPDQLEIGEREKFLIYGEFGTGKTFLTGTAPQPIYYLVVGGENEIKTLQSPDFLRKHGQVDYLWDSISEETGKRGHFKEAKAFDKACDLLDVALEEDRKGNIHFETVVVENGTTLSQVQMNKAMEINYNRVSNQSKSALGRLRDHNIVIPGDNDYMSQQSLMWQFVDWLFQLDKHVVLVAHEYVVSTFNRRSRQTEVQAIKPMFTGQHRERIPRQFDNVWRMTASGGGRSRSFQAQTVGDDIIRAKSRFGGLLPPTWRTPNLTNCIEKFQAYDPETDPKVKKAGTRK